MLYPRAFDPIPDPELFRNHGGRVIFLGDAPRFVDALPCPDAERFSERCERLPWDRARLNDSLLPLREIRILAENGRPADNLLCAIREDGGSRSVFIVHSEPARRGVPDTQEQYAVILSGLWTAERWDTRTGEIVKLEAEYGENTTELTWRCWGQDSLLLRLSPADQAVRRAAAAKTALIGSYGIRMAEELDLHRESPSERLLPPPDQILFGEDNVLLLDTAEWRIDGGPWEEAEDMLRIGIAAKEKLGISTAAASGAQPWILPPEIPEHTLSLRVSFRTEIDLPAARLALEDADVSRVLIDGVPLRMDQDGYFTDEAIPCFPTGPVAAGNHTVEITRPLTAASCTENCFLLGRFGVRVTGPEAVIVPAPDTIAYGDWTVQGLPFYSGPLTYRFRLNGGGRLRLRLGLFSAPCVTAELDGKRIANLSLSPSEADLGLLGEGGHVLDITVFPSRVNSFGALHLNDASVLWYGPQAWRSTGMRWTRTYRLTPSGLLSEPHLFSY